MVKARHASTAQLREAAEGRPGLSFEDRICLLLARDEGRSCVTNDKALRRACTEEQVPVIWGLELMIELVGKGRLSAASALAIAQKIQVTNPLHITPRILERFKKRLGLSS